MDCQRRKGNVSEGDQLYRDRWKVQFWWWVTEDYAELET